MSRKAKWCFAAAALLAAGGVALPFVLPALLPRGWLREEVGRQLGAALRRPVSVGNVRLSTFGRLRVVAEEVVVANADGFSNEPFLSVQEFHLGVALWPLLARRVEVGAIALSGVSALLEVDEAGRANWEGIAAAPQAREPAVGGSVLGVAFVGSAPPGGRAPVAVISAESIRLDRGEIVYRDRSRGESARLSGLELDFTIDRFAVPGGAEGGVRTILAGLVGSGRLVVAEVEGPGIALEDLSVDLAAEEGRLSLTGFARSRLGGSVRFDAKTDAVRMAGHDGRLHFDRFSFGGPFASRYLKAFGLDLVAGAVARLDGQCALAAEGTGGEAVWLSARGEGRFAVSGVNLGQIAAFEEGSARLRGSLGLARAYLREDSFASLQAQIDALGREVHVGLDFRVLEDHVENTFTLAATSRTVLSVPGTVDKKTFAIRYVVSESSFGDPVVAALWREYVGEEHEITGTAAAPDWNEGRFLSRLQRKVGESLLKRQIEKGISGGAEGDLGGLLDLFGKKKKR